ncbi:MAG: hypothetical protein D6707_09055, partial [Bacteroidetes bacterium]
MFYWFYASDVIFLASDSLRMVEAFDQDEADFLWLLIDAYNHHSFEIPLYCYGHLYYNIGLIAVYVFGLFSEIHDKEILVILRFTSLLFHFAAVFWFYHLIKKYFSRFSAWLSSILFLAGSGNLLYYTTNLHPDTTQLFFIVGFFWFLLSAIEKRNFSNYVMAALFAGLAFSVKYAGLFLLPVIFIAFLSNMPAIKNISITTKNAGIITALIIGLIFINPPVFNHLSSHHFDNQIIKTLNIVLWAITLIFFAIILFWKSSKEKVINIYFSGIVFSITFLVSFALTTLYGFQNLN